MYGASARSKRHRLTLHVRTHQRAVGVVVFEERDQRRGDRNELFRRDVHVLDVLRGRRVINSPAFARGVSLVDDVAVFIELDVGLTDDVFVLFPRGQIERPRLELGLFALGFLDLLVCRLDIFQRNVLARLELRVAAIVYLDVLDDAAVLDLSIRRLR